MKVMEGRVDWQDVVDDPPDMLCYSVTTGKHNYYMDINSGIRMAIKKDILSVFGGPHVTFFPEYIFGKYMDVGVRGEGFEAIVELANAVEAQESIADIDNLVFEGQVNPLRPLMSKDTMLYPDRDLIYRRPKNRDNPIKNVMCSFLCPYSCGYCYSKQYKQLYGVKTAEIRPVGEVMGEIDDLMRFPLEMIFFNDDIFPVYDTEWLDLFCNQYPLRCDKPFHVQLRAEYINDNVIRKLKEVGLHGVTFAIESGNEVLRNTILKRRMTNDAVIRAADTIHKHDVKLRTENMVGVPYETWGTAMETLDLNIQCNPTIAWSSLYQPYPGTELGDMCKSKGLFDGNINDIAGSFFDTYRLDVPEARRFEKLQKLLSLTVKYPVLKRALPILTRLPSDYKGVYSATKTRLYKELYKVA